MARMYEDDVKETKTDAVAFRPPLLTSYVVFVIDWASFEILFPHSPPCPWSLPAQPSDRDSLRTNVQQYVPWNNKRRAGRHRLYRRICGQYQIKSESRISLI